MATLLTSLESLDTLKGEWASLLSRSVVNSIFSTWDWQEICWRSFDGDAESLLVTVRDNGELVGVAPLARQMGTVRFLSSTDVSDYQDFISVRGRERDVLSVICGHLQSVDWEQIDLRSIRHDSPTLRHLPEIAIDQGWEYTVQVEDSCPIVDLPADWESYIASLSKKDRHELRRKMRRLEATQDFSWYVAPPAADAAKYIDTFLRLCRLSREEKARFLEDQRVETFFRNIIRRFLPSGLLKIYVMEISGRSVSVALCFDQGEELWLYNSGFDPSYANLSVGLLLKALCIRDAIESGKKRFDFLRGREPYKYDLGGADRPIYRVQIRRPSI